MLKCGFYEKEVTPPLGDGMPGYFGKRPAETVRDRLYAKALSMQMEEKTVIMVVIDAVSTTDTLCDAVLKRITEYTNVPAENIMISATHTHMGMPLPGREGSLSMPDETYFDVFERYVADAAILAWQNMVSCKVLHNKSIEEGLGFNRNYIMKDGSIRTNPGWNNPNVDRPYGPTDPEFSTLFFLDENDKPIGSLMSFACHHDSIGGAWGRKYSSDYSGVVAKNMKKEFGSDFVSVFVSGACGNINHIDIFRKEEKYEHPRYLDIGAQLSEAAIKQFKTAETLKTDSLDCIKEYVPVQKRYIPQEEIDEAFELYETMPLEGLSYNLNKPETKEYKRAIAEDIIAYSRIPNPTRACVQTIKIGDCMIFALCGEVYCEFGLAIKEKSPAKVNMVATLANGSSTCYIPIPEAYGTTIYEAQPSSAILEPNAGWIMVESALKQAEELNKN